MLIILHQHFSTEVKGALLFKGNCVNGLIFLFIYLCLSGRCTYRNVVRNSKYATRNIELRTRARAFHTARNNVMHCTSMNHVTRKDEESSQLTLRNVN